jgi:hypothetical protein
MLKLVYSLNINEEDAKAVLKKVERNLNGEYDEFIPPVKYTTKEIEHAYNWRGHWMVSPGERKWVEKKFEELLEK